jgi:hypothetical protein
MPDELMFVQFPHPGSEHKLEGPEMGWSRRKNHARKFLKADGRYLENGTVRVGSFSFWGEWEPPSRMVEPLDSHLPGWPRCLHEPLLEVPHDHEWRQNTDPLVFGEHFLYSNCKQAHNEKLRRPRAGSIVSFGSRKKGVGGDFEFVLDTVFVVGETVGEFTVDSSTDLDCPPWVQDVVFEPLRRDPKRPTTKFRLYRGRTYDEAASGPFCFVPCRPYERGGSAFPRPTIQLDRRWINPNLPMGAKATKATKSELSDLWHEIARQVNAAGLERGVKLAVPPGDAHWAPHDH